MKNKETVVFVAGAVIVVALLGAHAFAPSQAAGTMTNYRKLKLEISVVVSPASTVDVALSEYNPSGILEVPTADNWTIAGLGLSPCGNSKYPFGIAVFNGSYAAGNVSVASARRIALSSYLGLCDIEPSYSNYSYFFSPGSDVAMLEPDKCIQSADECTPNPLSAVLYPFRVQFALALHGYSSQGQDHIPFPSGHYTVVAGDEWGRLAFAYFSIP
jgi:hypothetical protein